jgi:tetratricopeptide (TPR) repeat protein
MKYIYLLTFLTFLNCNSQDKKDIVDKDGKVYHNDKTEMIVRDYDENNPLIIEAIELRKNNKPNEAIEKFNLAEKEYGEKLSIYLNRGTCYDQIGEKLKAITDYTKCLEIKSDYYAALQNRGLAYMNIKENEKALIDFNKAIEINSSEPVGYLNRAFFYNSISNYELSCSDAKKSVELGFIEKYKNELPKKLINAVCE